MIKTKLALLGGQPVRNKEFLSKPMVGKEEKNILAQLIDNNQFSKFVGSPIPGTYDILHKKSKDLSLDNVSSNVLGGEYVRKFEYLWSDITNSDYCISVNSATSGLTTALLALGLDPGSEVITTPFSFTATCAAIIAANYVPIFCDIDPDTFCLSPEKLEKLITPKTKCVVAVHWCGNVGDLDKISSICKDKNIYLIEDAAQAPTSFYKSRAVGTYGDLGVFSFNEPKNIMSGEGGLIVTNNEKFAIKCRLIRNHGEAIIKDNASDEDLINVVGYNFRMTEVHAAIAYVQTKKLTKINSYRENNYSYLLKNIKTKFSDYLIPQKITHLDSYYAYTASFKWNYKKAGVHRDIIAQALIAEGIPVFIGYHRLMCDHPMFKRKIAFGKKHYPWFDNDINYNNIDVKNARHLVANEFLGFLQTGYPNNHKDMDDIINAFAKIIYNIKSLKNYNASNKKLNIGR
jgi:perosamine synthetase